MKIIERIGEDTIRFERLLDAPVETVWRYLVDGGMRALWFAGGATDARTGGTIQLHFNHDALSDEDVPYPDRYCAHRGTTMEETIVACDPPHLFAFTFGGGGIARFELSGDGDRTLLVLTHSGITNPASFANFGGGWNSHLAVLAAKLRGEGISNFWALHAESEAAVAEALA